MKEIAILFDFDGTVMDTALVISESFRHLFRKYAREEDFTEERAIEVLGPTLDESMDRYFPTLDHAQLMEDYRAYQRSILDEMVRPMPHAIEVISWLKKKNYHVGLVSSRYCESMLDILNRHNMKEYFEVFIGKGEVANPKPDPEGILKACSMLGVDSCVYVGDSDTDIIAGHRANAKTVALVSNREKEESLASVKPTALIHDLIELKQLIEELEQENGNC